MPASNPSLHTPNRKLKIVVGIVSVLLVAVIIGIVLKRSGGPPSGRNRAGARQTPTGKEGAITGLVSYTGNPPEPKTIDLSADSACGQKGFTLVTEEWVVRDGKLANTFVYIREGTLRDGTRVADYSTWPNAPTSATLDQNGCHYKPHVQGVMVDEPITITNSDPTTHNVHFVPKNNPSWNQSQQNGAPPLTHKFELSEMLVPVKCDQHPWMRAYVGVLTHPFFAVSKEDGTFKITDVPPGKYTVVAWHEGGAAGTEKATEVIVPANGAVTVNFDFGAGAMLRGSPSSLRMSPAIEFPMPVRH